MASGDTLVAFGAWAANNPPSSNYATLDTRNGYQLLDFDATTDESMIFGPLLMPRSYAAGGVTVSVWWGATSATSGTVSIDVSFLSISDDADDIDTKSFAAANNSGAVTAPSASGEFGVDAITFTDGADMDSVAAGEFFFLKVTRDADSTTATDNMTGDMELLGIEIKET